MVTAKDDSNFLRRKPTFVLSTAIRQKHECITHLCLAAALIGTAGRFIGDIRREGLCPMKRNYVHLSETLEQAYTIDAHHGSPVVLAIDTKQIQEDGYVFYNPKKGIWLTTEIECKYCRNLI